VVIQDAIRGLVDEGVLTGDLAAAAMTEIMRGEASEAQIGAYLAALRVRGESADVLAASARVMQDHAEVIEVDDVIDVVGTGGDGVDTFNVSTAAALIVAGAGGRVAKHGNRAMSSQTGSADVLEALGARTDLGGPAVAKVINECGFCFVFAQRFHPAMRHVAAARRELGVRTIFNLLGPLTNPARPKAQLTGVASAAHAPLVAEAFALRGVSRAIIVRAADGLDEISPSTTTQAWFVEGEAIREIELAPSDFGLPAHPLEAVKGGPPGENAAAMLALLDGKAGPVQDFVLMNAAAALVVAGLTGDLLQGVELARETLENGRARRVLDDYVRLTQEVAE
jgi:anthranilate phosphoribosyltransferase